MELRYPYVIVFLIIISILIFFLSKKKVNKYITGSKIANTHYLKSSDYYKQKVKKYSIIKKMVLSLFFISFICCSILLSRLTKVQTIKTNQYNRDIYLCMDVSSSVDELNLELVETLKSTVNKLHGERFGISIFNTSSVTLVPLTDDYTYVIDTLNQIKNHLSRQQITHRKIIYTLEIICIVVLWKETKKEEVLLLVMVMLLVFITFLKLIRIGLKLLFFQQIMI